MDGLWAAPQRHEEASGISFIPPCPKSSLVIRTFPIVYGIRTSGVEK
jgi:hypothetical protein